MCFLFFFIFFFMFYSSRMNVVSLSLRSVLPIYFSDFSSRRKIIRTNYVLDRSYYVEIGEVYGCSFLRYNYGINACLSELFIFTCGLNRRTPYYFFYNYFDIKYVVSFFNNINKLLFQTSFFFLKKKFNAHTYWSTLYLSKYPCRGQRRRTNASTCKKLNIVSKLNSSFTK